MPLAELELKRLQECEAVIAKDLAAFERVGNALNEINDSRLYRAEFGSFNEYVESRWKLSARRAYQMMEAAAVAASLEKQGLTVANEAQAAALADVPAEKRAEVLNIVAQSGEKVTAARIEQAAKSITNTSTEPEPQSVRKIITQRKLSSEIERAVTHLLDILESDQATDIRTIEAIEENIRFAFETLEERILKVRPQHAVVLAGALRGMLSKVEELV